MARRTKGSDRRQSPGSPPSHENRPGEETRTLQTAQCHPPCSEETLRIRRHRSQSLLTTPSPWGHYPHSCHHSGHQHQSFRPRPPRSGARPTPTFLFDSISGTAERQCPRFHISFQGILSFGSHGSDPSSNATTESAKSRPARYFTCGFASFLLLTRLQAAPLHHQR